MSRMPRQIRLLFCIKMSRQDHITTAGWHTSEVTPHTSVLGVPPLCHWSHMAASASIFSLSQVLARIPLMQRKFYSFGI